MLRARLATPFFGGRLIWLLTISDYQYGIDRFNEYIQKYGRVSQRRDLLTKMIGSKENDPDALADSDIAVEISNLCFAATDTTGTSLVYLFWELARNPDLAERLRSLLTDLPLVDGAIQHQSVSNLPFLDALIMEGLRAYPPIPAGLPREAPVGGCNIDGIYVPQGVSIYITNFSSMRGLLEPSLADGYFSGTLYAWANIRL